MKFTLPLCLAALVAFPFLSQAQTIEQRYVTRWNVQPIARLSMDKPLVVNGTRCRIDNDGPYKDKWLPGREVGTVLGKTTWQVELDTVPPGAYNVTFDLRTPDGAQWIPGALRVPQIARNTGHTGPSLTAPKVWPQDQHPNTANDKGPVQFAWDRDNLYIRPTAGAPKSCEVTLDLLPALPGKHTKAVKVNGVTTVAWADLFPAGPFTGQTLRYKISSDWIDLLLVGSGQSQYYDANVVSDIPGGDDQGPPVPILDALKVMSGLNCNSFSLTWRDVEPTDPGDGPSVYDWSEALKDAKYQTDGLVYCSINLHTTWAEDVEEKDPERYWKLAERFVKEAAKKAAVFGVTHFSAGFNEPEMHFRSDKEVYFNNNLTRVGNAIREVVPEAKIIGGKFCGGDPDTIRNFHAYGFRDNFDIIDIHPYNNDPNTGCHIGEVVATHDLLEELGMGHKQIFLGEGWGTGRELHQVERKQWDAPFTQAEADCLRGFYQNGYRTLVSARADYNPDWVIGAKYFTLNDNVGSTYWKQAAKPVYGADGELQHYLIGGLRFDKNSNFDARFFNGGLIDFQGNPKGPWFFDFPPALPEVRFLASGGPDYVLEGEWHTINISVVNANPRPITGLKISARDRSVKFKGQISAEPIGESERASLAPGEVWQTSIRMRADQCPPRKVRWSVEMDYNYDGEKHYADDAVPTEVRQPLQVKCEPAGIVLSGNKPQPVTVSVFNNKREPVTFDTIAYNGREFTAISGKKSITIPSGQSRTFQVTVTPKSTEPGRKVIPLINGSDVTLQITTPLPCPQLTSAPKLDGDLSDWPKEAVAQGAITFSKSITKSERPPSDPFPVPPPINQPGVSNIVNEEVRVPRFAANAAIAWSPDGLYIGVITEDNNFIQDYTGAEVWRGDSVQFALDPLINGGLGFDPYGKEIPGYKPDDREIVMALTGYGTQITCIHDQTGNTGPIKDAQLTVKRDGKFTVYEARIPWTVLPGFTPVKGGSFAFDILVNNQEDSEHFSIGWADGIGRGKYPGRYVPIILN